uniref:Uncharacterized protein n=1 Tax=Anguilla anguilla TaxID=7936 RepID=A0A0E9PNI6_ANGAN
MNFPLFFVPLNCFINDSFILEIMLLIFCFLLTMLSSVMFDAFQDSLFKNCFYAALPCLVKL